MRLLTASLCATVACGARQPLDIQASLTGDAMVGCSFTNRSDRVIHVFDSPRMPYLLQEGSTLIALHGVHEPPRDRDLNMIEIPLTRPLPPGEALRFEVSLGRLHGHHGDEPLPGGKALEVVCRVGYGESPIDEAARRQLAITAVLAWQKLVAAKPIKLPERP